MVFDTNSTTAIGIDLVDNRLSPRENYQELLQRDNLAAHVSLVLLQFEPWLDV